MALFVQRARQATDWAGEGSPRLGAELRDARSEDGNPVVSGGPVQMRSRRRRAASNAGRILLQAGYEHRGEPENTISSEV